jgi:hypothetical protein
VPVIMVSPWVEPGSVFNQEYRHICLYYFPGWPKAHLCMTNSAEAGGQDRSPRPQATQ